MKKFLTFRVLVLLASSLIFLRCDCDKDEPMPNPPGSANPLTVFLSNPTPWQYGSGTYSITITGIEKCNSGYNRFYQVSYDNKIDVVPPSEGQFRILVKFQLTANTYGDYNDGCPGTCSGYADGYPTYETFIEYKFSGTSKIGCGLSEPSQWESAWVNIKGQDRIQCDC